MFLISNPPTAMENSSVYMCFPCYQEFNTLEEVLKHQLTCTAGDEQPDTSGTNAVTVPVLQTQVSADTVVAMPFLSCDCDFLKILNYDIVAWNNHLCDHIKASESYLESDFEVARLTLVINSQCSATYQSNSDLGPST